MASHCIESQTLCTLRYRVHGPIHPKPRSLFVWFCTFLMVIFTFAPLLICCYIKKTYPFVNSTSILPCIVQYDQVFFRNSNYILYIVLHCNKRLSIFPSPTWMSPTKASDIFKLFPARESRLVTSRLESGKSLTFFTVYILLINTVGSAVLVFVESSFQGSSFNEKLMRTGVEGRGEGYCLVSSDRPNSLTR